MNKILEKARAIEQEIIADRRCLHQMPEVGVYTPRTAAYIKERLTEMGIAHRDCGVHSQEDREKMVFAGYPDAPTSTGVVAVIGKGGPCILLRADMDALRVREATGLDFQSENGAMHATKKYRGKIDNAIMSYVKDMEADLKAARPERVFITHSGCSREVVEEVRSYLKELNVFCEILETRAGGVISSHCGPGTLGVLFIAK